MRVADRVRRWWNPAEWRDDHPAEGGSSVVDPGRPLDADERLEDRLRDRGWYERAQDLGQTFLPRQDDH